MPAEEEEMDDVEEFVEDKEPIATVDAIYRTGKVYLDDTPTAQILHDKAYFGTKVSGNRLELECLEAILLQERKRINIYTESHELITKEKLFELAAHTDDRVWVKYLVYRDLRQRGYIVRMGYGDGIDFRVYPRGSAREEDIAKFFIFILPEGDPVRLDILDRITRQTVQARKELILAIIDRLGDPTYYELEQFRLLTNDKLNAQW